MRLTTQHLLRVPAPSGGQAADNFMQGRRFATDDDHEQISRAIIDDAGEAGALWVFAYGSLIWNPCFEHVEQRTALASGWHRSFCLGWDMWFRGCADRPGLMLALDRGGRCSGIAFRLPPETARENVLALLKREVILLPHPFPARWLQVSTAKGPIRALSFAIDRRSANYIGGLSLEEIATALASASGQRGTMAEYLLNTVTHLERLGLRDRHLWALQELVAARLEDDE